VSVRPGAEEAGEARHVWEQDAGFSVVERVGSCPLSALGVRPVICVCALRMAMLRRESRSFEKSEHK
jgi:hypothetical protein